MGTSLLSPLLSPCCHVTNGYVPAVTRKDTCMDLEAEININNLILPKGLRLERDDGGLFLTDGELILRADLNEMLPRLKQSNLERELLVKASRLKGRTWQNAAREDTDVKSRPDGQALPVAFDATAGFGEDSLLLSAAGFNVVLFEKDPVIAALLEDALFRAEKCPALYEAVQRMTLIKGDSISEMKALKSEASHLLPLRPDIIYLDPMFPERKKSGLIKKKFQLLQRLERPCADEEELLYAALALQPKKLIIKRPLKGPFLAGVKPGYSVSGKSIRYDVIVNAGTL